MFRIVSGARVMALAFSHPSYTTTHKQNATIIEDGKVTVGKQDVERTSRKTVATLYDVLLGGEFVKRAEAEVRVHWQDNFDRKFGRKLALKKMLDPASKSFTPQERADIWEVYWNRHTAEQISFPKPKATPMGQLVDFPQTSESTMQAQGNTHPVVSWLV